MSELHPKSSKLNFHFCICFVFDKPVPVIRKVHRQLDVTLRDDRASSCCNSPTQPRRSPSVESAEIDQARQTLQNRVKFSSKWPLWRLPPLPRWPKDNLEGIRRP